MSKIRDDIIWLAGLLEGEGCFTTFDVTPGIVLQMTDKDIVERVSKVFGTEIRKTNPRTKNCKFTYIIRVYGGKAIGVMFSIYPFMGKRRKARIKEVINKWKSHVNKRTKLNSRIVEFIRNEYKNGLSSIELANKYNVARHVIWQITNYETWKII